MNIIKFEDLKNNNTLKIKIKFEDLKNNNTLKIKNEPFDFKIMTVRSELDELDDVMWGKDGTCQMQYLDRHVRALNSNFGEFSNISIGFNTPTTVIYKVMIDVEGNEVFQTRGQHPEFYEGWVSSIKRRSIFATSLDFDRQSHKRESRLWIKGFLSGCEYQCQKSESVKDSFKNSPYAAGVLLAYNKMRENGLIGCQDTPQEESVNLISKINNSGYSEMTKACNALWEKVLPELI